MSRLGSQLYAGARMPIVWQSYRRERLGVPPLYMQVNPQQVQFQQGKRIQRQDTIGGTTFFHFTNRRGQNNDILTLQISGTTGNIDPRSYYGQTGQPQAEGVGDAIVQILGPSSGGLSGVLNTVIGEVDRTKARENLLAWMSFYQLSLEPIQDADTGKPNLVTMSYISPLFPKPVKFTGFFMNAVQFSETAADPFQRQWSVQFTVQRTDPSLDTVVDYFALQMVDETTLQRVREMLGF